MRNLFLVLLLLITLKGFTQVNNNIEFYDYLVNHNYIDNNIKFDTSNVKKLIDSLKGYVISKKRLEFPKVCNKTSSAIFDLNDYMNCFTGSFLNRGTLLYQHFPIEVESNKNDTYSKFAQYIKDNIVGKSTNEFKVYIDIFNFEHENITFVTDPINLESYEVKETTNNCFMFFIVYL